MVMIADRIRALREKAGLTQTELSKRLGITRSGVNAWEMGVSVPSSQYLVELAKQFDVSTDYLLGVAPSASIGISGLTEGDVQLVHTLVHHLKEKNKAQGTE